MLAKFFSQPANHTLHSGTKTNKPKICVVITTGAISKMSVNKKKKMLFRERERERDMIMLRHFYWRKTSHDVPGANTH